MAFPARTAVFSLCGWGVCACADELSGRSGHIYACGWETERELGHGCEAAVSPVRTVMSESHQGSGREGAPRV